MVGTASNSSSLFTLLVVALVLVVSLHAAVFKVNVKQPTEAQRQLHKKWHRAHHLAFAKRSGKSAAAAQKWRQLHPKEAAARMVGAAGDGESAEIDDLDVISTSWNWYNPQGTIKLGIPPQDFIVAFSTISPDTFVSQEGSATWDNFMSFNANKSYTFSSDNITFQDSLFMNTTYYKCGDAPNTGIVGKDLITLGDTLVLPLKFGVVNNLTSQVCMDWNNHDVEGVFGMSLAKSKNPGMAPTLQQIAPILDEPVVSVLTHKVEDKNELEYHMKIGSSHIEGHCSPSDYTYFPSTSAFTTPEEQPKKDGYNTKLWSVELRYPNGSFAKWNQPAGTSMQFNSLVHTSVYYTDPYIYGDSNTVDELVAQLGGETDWLGYSNVPCNVSAAAPNLILYMGNSTQKVEYVIKPEEYTLPHPWFTGQCVSVLQYHSWYPAWTSSEYHTNMCFALKFGAGGDMIGLARPKKG